VGRRDRSLVVDVADLVRSPGSRLDVRTTVPAAGVRSGDVAVADGEPITIAIDLESLSNGLVATGLVSARWRGGCRRCLEAAEGDVVVTVRELFRARAEPDDEAFPIVDDQIDLAPVVTEVLVCDLPLAPLCSDDCQGLCPQCGANRNHADCGHDERPSDPRWAALEALRDQLG
jgi:uncharacterized protein